MKQGAVAYYSGRDLENAVEGILKNSGIKSVKYSDWRISGKKACKKEKGILLKRVPYINIFGGRGRGEFLLSVNGKEDIRIECRAQNSRGSVDEKIPCLFENACAFKEKYVILVVEGNGFKSGVRQYLKNKCESVRHKNIKMMSLKDFSSWALKNL